MLLSGWRPARSLLGPQQALRENLAGLLVRVSGGRGCRGSWLIPPLPREYKRVTTPQPPPEVRPPPGSEALQRGRGRLQAGSLCEKSNLEGIA